MSPTVESLGLDQLPVEQRVALARDLWASIEDEPHSPLLTESQRNELERRLLDHEKNPDGVIPWEQVRDDALERCGQ